MRAQKLLYVFARRYQMISACMTVSVRELRTAVREWACCDTIRITIFASRYDMYRNTFLTTLEP